MSKLLHALLLGLFLLPSVAQARSLELQEIYEMEQYLDCATNTCGHFCQPVWDEPQSAHYLQFVACESCLEDQGCGEALRIWEKDGVEPVTLEDHNRAILEQQYPDEVCYADDERSIVLPPELCGGPLCEGVLDQCLEDYEAACVAAPNEEGPDVECDEQGHCWFATAPSAFNCPDFLCDADADTFASFNAGLLCVDTDMDQLPSWVEQSLEGETSVPCEPGQNQCAAGMVCAESEFGAWRCQYQPCDYDNPCGFREVCETLSGVAVATCQTRGVCDGGGAAVSFFPGADDGPVGEICDPQTGSCLDCIYHAHCDVGERCTVQGDCVAADACSNSLDCTGTQGQVCDVKEGFCVDCVSDAECAEGTVCGPAATCVTSCDSDQDCTGDGMLCSFTSEEGGYCAQCAGDEGCDYSETCVLGVCQPRKCSDGELCLLDPADQIAAEAVCPDLNCNANLAGENPSCTAFHLEKVAEDDTEVIVHVHYDHTPIPARVLDLYLTYDDSQLLLQDARPLKPLQLKGKNLASSHLSDGTLVLNIYDDDGTHPVPKGPIVEMVFKRVGVCPTEIGFATDRYDLLPLSVAPLQGSDELQDTLADPDLWGAPVRLCARSTIPTRLRLSYAYESLASPMEYANVPSPEEICSKVPACEFEADPAIKARLIARIAAMQGGDILASESVPGVAGNAAYLDGASDHVTMPVHYDTPLTGTAQSFSFSTWFYTEGNSSNELSSTPQVLYSHNAYNERTSYGLLSQDTVGGDSANLIFFLGDLLDADLAPAALQDPDKGAQQIPNGQCAKTNFLQTASAFFVQSDIELRTWHHVAFSFNAETRIFELYFDGERVGCIEVEDLPESSQCPQLHAATDVTIHDEGDVLGGRSPEYLWLAAREGGLNKIRRMDPAGLQSETILGDSEFNYQDPHYSTILDRIVFSSDASGSTEIWIANGDGSNRKQITFDFGDASRGISARRPRFAPDGSSIVFDSNVFDVVKKDNQYARVRHIYLIQYDADANEVAVTLPDNSTTTTLNYEDRLADGTIDDYRLTDTLDRHHKSARWLTGADDTAFGRELGALLIDTSKDDMSGHRVFLLTIPTAYPLSSVEPVPGLGVADEVRLLDAYHFVKAAYPSPILTERALITRENLLWEKDGESFDVPDAFELTGDMETVPAQFTVQCDNGGTLGACSPTGSTEVVVSHNPNTYSTKCWDKNFNNNLDDEDLNADGELDVDDCYPPTQDLYLTYDYNRYEPVLDVVQRCSADSDCDGGQVCGMGDAHYAANPVSGFKQCELANKTVFLDPSTTPSAACPSGFTPFGSNQCAAIAPSTLACAQATDCGAGSYLCDYNVCKPKGSGPKMCISQSDCAGTELCLNGYCASGSSNDTYGGLDSCTVTAPSTGSACTADADCTTAGEGCVSGLCKLKCSVDKDCATGQVCQLGECMTDSCGSGTVCSPVEPKKCVAAGVKSCLNDSECATTERCQANECVVMGSHLSTGGVRHTKSCVLDVDCGGGQVCSNSACLLVTQAATCASDSTECAGGQVCNTDEGMCRPAEGTLPLCDAACTAQTCSGCDLSEGIDCEDDADCLGGEACNLAAGKCRQASGEKLVSLPGGAIDQWVGGKKTLELTGRFGSINGAQYGLVRIEVRSPLSADPIPSGGLVTVRFKEKPITSYSPLTPEIYIPRIHSETGVKDLTGPAPPVLFDPGEFFEQITGGAFSPDGEQLMLGTITNARPHLLMTDELEDSLNVGSAGDVPYYSVSESKRVTSSPLAVSGIEWERQSRLYACNWLGAYLHFQSKAYMYGFRGGLEDTKIYSGLRDADAIRSEAERGTEFLVKNGLSGQVDSKLPSCGNSHLECPPFHLCIESECQMRACDPSDPWSCADVGGRCTLRPISVEQEQTDASGSSQGYDWVCSADCNNDNQCFTQVCLNGPCRFCDASLTCIECRDSTTQLGELTIAGIEGCPDQRSFACDSGACVTDCYAFEDGQSIYLCDETTEYCDAGQCVLLDWDWWDLAPATFSGAGDMRLKVAPDAKQGWGGYTEAIDQRVPITIQAYGNEDWTHSPEMVVEVKGGLFYGAEWNRIAKIPVTNRTAVEAQNNPYVVTSSFIFEDVRLRLVTSPMANSHKGATGLMEKDEFFCIEEQIQAGKSETEAKTYCAHRPSGSRANLGYPIQISKRQQIDYCNEQGHSGCDYVKQSEHDYLLPGSRGVVVMDVNVDGAGVMNNITQNKVCHYEGGESSLTAKDGGKDSKMVYGRLGEELSAEGKAAIAACEPSLAPSDHTAIWTGDGEISVQTPPAIAAPTASAGLKSVAAGVANGLHYGTGQVNQALVFDHPTDSLQIPPSVISGSDAFSMETWVRTGDLEGGLLSLSSRPSSCAEWRDRGRTSDGEYAIWVNNRPIPVFCHGMTSADDTPKSYLTLEHTSLDVNASVYRAGGDSYGSTVKTAYKMVAFDAETMSLDLSDTTFTFSNGGKLGHNCVPGDPSDLTQSGCFHKEGHLQHLWRGEESAEETVNDSNKSAGVEFVAGRIGMAMDFGADGGYVASAEKGLPDGTQELTVEGWINTASNGADQIIARLGDYIPYRTPVRAPDAGLVGDCAKDGGVQVPDEQCAVAPGVDEICCEVAWSTKQQGAWELALEGGQLRFFIVGATQQVADDLTEENPTQFHAEAAYLRGGTITEGQWQHVAATVELDFAGDHHARLYLDGVKVAQSDEQFGWDVPVIASSTPVILGQRPLGQGRFIGKMDDVAIWSTQLEDDELAMIEHLGQPGTGVDGDGFGKCLLSEIQNLSVCGADDLVTALPLGVAYACMGPGAEAEVKLDLRGTPVRFPADIASQFSTHTNDGSATAVVSSVGWTATAPQQLQFTGGGSCGGTAPASWSGDPTAIAAGTKLTVKLLDEAAVAAQWCHDGDGCLFKTLDELLVVALDAQGLKVRSQNQDATNPNKIVSHGSSDLNDYGWHHLAVVRDASTLRIYVDGQEIFYDHTVSLLKSADLKAVDTIVIGQEGHCAIDGPACDDANGAFAGRLDEMAFYNRALLNSEVTTLAAEGRRGRPVLDRPNPTCPDLELGLVSFDAQSQGLALLNCDFVDSDPTGDTAGVILQNVIVERKIPAEAGSVIYDSGDVCLIEVTPNLTVPCFGWIGSDANVDSYNDLVDQGSYEPFQTLEVSLPRSFGHDEGFEGIELPKHPLTVNVSFTEGGPAPVLIDWDPRTTGLGNGVESSLQLAQLAVNRTFDVRIVEPPDGFRCAFESSDPNSQSCPGLCASGEMDDDGVTLEVSCEPLREISVTVKYLEADKQSSIPVPSFDDLLELSADANSTTGQVQSAILKLDSSVAPGAATTFTNFGPVDQDSVTLRVDKSPAGFGCTFDPVEQQEVNFVVSGDMTRSITCVESPTHAIDVEVTGLADASGVVSCAEGTGLEVRVTGIDEVGTQAPEVLCIDTDGTDTTALQLLEGGLWTAELISQPSLEMPDRRRCAITSLESGTVQSGGGDTKVSVTCEAPTIEVTGTALQLHHDIEIALMVGPAGEATELATSLVEAPPSSLTPPPTPWSFEVNGAPVLLYEDEPFHIVGKVIHEKLTCTNFPSWAATTPLPQNTPLVINCDLIPEPTYNLSGVVKGLQGEGLAIQFGGGAVTLNVDPAGGADVPLAFNSSFVKNQDYLVEVNEHPQGQFCSVINGTGKFGTSDISNVIVFCQYNTKVVVDLQAPAGFSSSHARATLIKVGAGSYLASEVSHSDVSAQADGSMSFEMQGKAPTGAADDQNTNLPQPPITSGQYMLTIWLTNKISSATDEPIYKIGESIAATRTLFINAPLPETHEVNINASEFSTTVGGPVTMFPKTPLVPLEKGQQIECAWSPYNASPPVPPFKANNDDTKLTNLLPPVLGKSVFKCEETNGCKIVTQQEFLDFILAIISGEEELDESAPKMVGAVGTGIEDFPLLSEPALPAGVLLDVTCWADSKDSDLGGVVDDGGTGKLSVGDSYGRVDNVQSGAGASVSLSKFDD